MNEGEVDRSKGVRAATALLLINSVPPLLFMTQATEIRPSDRALPV
jgi:hypothetical protein